MSSMGLMPLAGVFMALVLLLLKPISRPDSLALVHWLLVWGVAVVTPQTLSFTRTAREVSLYNLLRVCQPLAALAMGSGWLWEGIWLRIGASFWLGYTLLLALWGLVRWRDRTDFDAAEATMDLGLIYSLVGGIWTFAYAWWGGLMGFDRTMTLLTGAHFCFVTLGAMQWAALAGRAGTDWPRLYGILVRLYWISPALVAAGITASQRTGHATWLEALAVSAQVVATSGISLISLRHHPLVTLSAVCSLAPMLLALNYAWGRVLSAPHLDLAWMIPYHGLVNALGFVTLGLLGYSARLSPGSVSADRW